MDLKSARFESKREFKLPKGAKLMQKDASIAVREISNGFIVRKSYEIKYTLDGETKYDYFDVEVYSETNPLKIELNDKSLADKLGD